MTGKSRASAGQGGAPGGRRREPATAPAAAATGRAERPSQRFPEAPEVLVTGAATLGVPLSPRQVEQLEAYLDLLQRWGRTYNLTAILDRPAMRVQHLLDSLALVPHLPPTEPAAASAQAPEQALDRPAGAKPVLLDVGSGAGLPGVVVAVARPDWRVICVDAVAKKVGFIRQVAVELGLPHLHACHARVEALADQSDWQALAPQGARVITSRAFASLADFLAATGRLRSEAAGEWVAMKGVPPVEEIDALRLDDRYAHAFVDCIDLAVPHLEAQRCLVRVRFSP